MSPDQLRTFLLSSQGDIFIELRHRRTRSLDLPHVLEQHLRPSQHGGTALFNEQRTTTLLSSTRNGRFFAAPQAQDCLAMVHCRRPLRLGCCGGTTLPHLHFTEPLSVADRLRVTEAQAL